MLPYSLLKMMETVTAASGRYTVNDSPQLSLWDLGASSWVDALRDITPQTPEFNWPNPSTIARRRSQWDTTPHPVWDGGVSEWIDAAQSRPGTPSASASLWDDPPHPRWDGHTRYWVDYTGLWDGAPFAVWDEGYRRWLEISDAGNPAYNAPRWVNGPAISRRNSAWDVPPQAYWDAGASRWLDCAPGWDTAPGSDKRTWIIGKAGEFGGNILSATGIMHTARVWIKPPDPATAANLQRRTVMRNAVALWHNDPQTCTATATNNQPGTYWSPFHRWIAHYLRTH